MIIAIDGPAGSGKSSVSKVLSNKLEIQYLDSGAIYRAITKKMLDSSIKIEDYRAVEKLLNEIKIDVNGDKVFINGEDFTPYIRTKDVTEYVSIVSSNGDIRNLVNQLLRNCASNRSVVMDGRDIASCVFPNADYKFYLDASVEIRARRRWEETGRMTDIEEIKKSIIDRDNNDKNRKIAPLKLVDEAIYIDTTDMSLDQVVNKMLFYIKNS